MQCGDVRFTTFRSLLRSVCCKDKVLREAIKKILPSLLSFPFSLQILTFAEFFRPSHLPFSLFLSLVCQCMVWSCCLLRPFTWGSETRIHTGMLKAFGILVSIHFFKYTCFLITPEMTFASVEQVSNLNSANFLRSARRVLDPSHLHKNFPKLSPNT